MMGSGYGINIFELKSDLTVIEDYYTLANNILELRRFEKNLIFDLGKSSYNSACSWAVSPKGPLDMLPARCLLFIDICMIKAITGQQKKINDKFEFGVLSV